MTQLRSCVLKNLGNPLLNGLCLGLSFQNDDVSLQNDMFPCCDAKGQSWDAIKEGQRSCALPSRLLQVRRLYHQFRKTWPHSSRGPQQIAAQYSNPILQEIAAVLRHDQPAAQVSLLADRKFASLHWTRALACIWRFGIHARVLNLSRCQLADQVEFTQNHTGPLALFVENIDQLWDPQNAEAIDQIIHRAYNAQAYLWLDFVNETEQSLPAAEDLSAKAEFSRRIAKKKRSKHPLAYLCPDSISRLQSMSAQTFDLGKGQTYGRI